jgi:transcriptional regulator with XRE-family HTH domain
VLNENISATVARLLETRKPKLTVAEFGRRMGVSRQQAARYVNGERDWGAEWLEKAAEALGVEPWELVRGEPEPPFSLERPAAIELARGLCRVALHLEPTAVQTDLLAQSLIELVDILAGHPAGRSDPEAAKLVVEILARQSGQR